MVFLFPKIKNDKKVSKQILIVLTGSKHYSFTSHFITNLVSLLETKTTQVTLTSNTLKSGFKYNHLFLINSLA